MRVLLKVLTVPRFGQLTRGYLGDRHHHVTLLVAFYRAHNLSARSDCVSLLLHKVLPLSFHFIP